jgi:hypothetical protein
MNHTTSPVAGRTKPKIEPLVAVMAAGARTASARRPDLAQDRLQSEAVFIERPDFDRDRRVGALELADAGLELS